MPITWHDVDSLQHSIHDLGQSFAGRRQEADAAEIRRLMLQKDIERNQAEQAHHQRMETAQTGTQDMAAKRLQQQQDQQTLQDLIKANPMITDASREKANNYLRAHPQFGAIGLELAKPAAPQPGQNTHAQALAWAQKYHQMADAEEDPDKQTLWESYASDLENTVKNAGRAGGGATETIEFPEKPATPGTPEVPAKTHLFRSDEPAIPATPPTQYQPKRIIRRPIGATTAEPSGQAPTQVSQAPADPKQRKSGQRYSTPKGTYTWTGTGWAQ